MGLILEITFCVILYIEVVAMGLLFRRFNVHVFSISLFLIKEEDGWISS